MAEMKEAAFERETWLPSHDQLFAVRNISLKTKLGANHIQE
jgi:hypothetical protein